MPSSARATPNIAFIKYWGNRNDELRLPANDSIGLTLDTPSVDVTVDFVDALSVVSTTRQMTETDTKRFEKFLQLTKNYLVALGHADNIPNALSIEIDSGIPSAVGLASSSAVFAAVAKAIAGLINADLTDEQISVIARLGSGSAARSIYGGYGGIVNSSSVSIDGATGFQAADENHWLLHDIVIAPSIQEKEVGSSQGHPMAHSSPHFVARTEAIASRRQQEALDAIASQDFEKLQRVTEEDCDDMHKVMQTQDPPLNYLSEDTHRILGEMKQLRASENLAVCYTMDAGPTVHLFCTEDARDTVAAFAHSQKNCQVFEAKTGPGARLI